MNPNLTADPRPSPPPQHGRLRLQLDRELGGQRHLHRVLACELHLSNRLYGQLRLLWHPHRRVWREGAVLCQLAGLRPRPALQQHHLRLLLDAGQTMHQSLFEKPWVLPDSSSTDAYVDPVQSCMLFLGNVLIAL
jgi:hypothetical protein